MKLTRLILLTVFLLCSACSAKQWHKAGQEMNCQDYHQTIDPHYRTQCKKGSYEDYQQKRETVTKDLLPSK